MFSFMSLAANTQMPENGIDKCRFYLEAYVLKTNNGSSFKGAEDLLQLHVYLSAFSEVGDFYDPKNTL